MPERDSSIRRKTLRASLPLVAVLAASIGTAHAAGAEADARNLGCERARHVQADASGLPSGEQIHQWIADLTSFGYRRSGTVALRQAEEYIRCHFETIGLSDVRFEESTTWQWEADAWGLEVEGTLIDSFPVHHSFITPGAASEFSTGPAGLTAELVDIGRGTEITPEQVAGRIAVFDLRFLIPSVGLLLAADFWWDPWLSTLARPEALLQSNPYQTNITEVIGQLMDAGAVGFVGVLADYFDSNQYYNEYYRRQEFTLPGLWVTRGEGERIRALLRDAPEARATLTLEGSRREVPARTIIGMLPGASTDTIQVQSHHDSSWEGGVQDGSGAATLLALAHYFAAQPAESRNKTLMFTTFSSHWTGYQAHNDFVDRYVTNNQSPYRLVANVTVEHLARHGIINRRTGELEVTNAVEPRGIINNVGFELTQAIAEAVKRNDMRRTALLRPNVIGMPTDASFIHGAGVPTISLISGPVYLYDRVDTLEMVPRRELERVPPAFVDIIKAVDRTPSDRIADDGRLAAMAPGEFDRMMGGWVGYLFRWAPWLRWLLPAGL